MISKSTILRVTAIALSTLITLWSAGTSAQGAGYLAWRGTTAEGEKCTGGQPEAGPYDYLQRQRLAGQILIVEQFHFNEDVENLKKGMTGTVMNDIDYTLRAIPNHHRALRSAVKYRLRRKNWPKNHQGEKAECYLQRAIAFSPKDPTLKPLLAFLLHRLKHPELAIPVYRRAVEQNPGDIMLKYNMGLAFTEIKNYYQANVVAVEIYATDFPLQGLKNKLIAANVWKENPDEASGESDGDGDELTGDNSSEKISESTTENATESDVDAEVAATTGAGEEPDPDTKPKSKPDGSPDTTNDSTEIETEVKAKGKAKTKTDNAAATSSEPKPKSSQNATGKTQGKNAADPDTVETTKDGEAAK